MPSPALLVIEDSAEHAVLIVAEGRNRALGRCPAKRRGPGDGALGASRDIGKLLDAVRLSDSLELLARDELRLDLTPPVANQKLIS